MLLEQVQDKIHSPLLIAVLGEFKRLLDLLHQRRFGGMGFVLRMKRGSSSRKHRCQKQDCTQTIRRPDRRFHARSVTPVETKVIFTVGQGSVATYRIKGNSSVNEHNRDFSANLAMDLKTSDTMSAYEGDCILGQGGCSATSFLPLQLS
jgi:hypothetical protein